jgi:hypothetical protein
MNNAAIFTRKDLGLFLVSGVLVGAGYLCMMLDPAPNGFGVLTLNIAPFLLLSGFFLPVAGIIGPNHWNAFFNLSTIRSGRRKHLAGLLVLATALATYVLTLEPTASLWDC